ncbi:hypothetical protein JIN84_17955 [Luteolibacter yonseiensis]|uniref:Uncharacterized protein n=1 Tax=Luteolibacter yonseiensis TaxID=1144680 RepID=A0A934R964_9BACT|nr:hypothetical protein [Luteolibacter yonseiensis]MBK1817510.1 hypothetical protein [Luteolibacter yonseiensis]
MNWININVTVLDSEEFLGAEPTERATWLCLLRYCVGQENGGRMHQAKQWKDRKWQQVVRVTSKEISTDCDLWNWEGEDLVVRFYPEEKEAEVKHLRSIGKQTSEAKKAAARTNGAKGGRPTIQPTDKPNGTEQETHAEPIERKEKGKELEGEEREQDAPALAPKNSASPTSEHQPDGWSNRMPTEQARDFDKLQSRINALHPSWRKRPHFSRIEQDELFANSRIFFDLKDQDWALLSAYMAVEIPESWSPKFWQPDNRSVLLKSVTDVLGHADRWKRESKRRGVATGLEGGAA